MRAESAAFYQRFSLEVGLRDWVGANPRHEHLKAIVDGLLRETRGIRILDVGCGAGVLSNYLTRFGTVVGIDLSAPAIELARRLVPRATFYAGTFDAIELRGQFDVISAFDVLEHIPPDDRRDFVDGLAKLLGSEGMLILSTPHAGYTRWVRAHNPDLLQPIDEPIDVSVVLSLASDMDLELLHYVTFDVDYARQYQLFVLARSQTTGSPAPHGLRQLRPGLGGKIARTLRRVPIAVRMGRTEGLRWAVWILLPRGEPPT